MSTVHPAAVVRKPPRPRGRPGWERRFRAADGVVASLALHLTLAFGLAVWTMSVPERPAALNIEAQLLGEVPAAGLFDGTVRIESAASAEGGDGLPALAPATEIEPIEPLTLDAPAMSDGAGFADAAGLAATGGTGSGAGVGGDAGEVAFFGSAGVGSSFVFVVDLSGSMVEQNRFTRMTRELSATIQQMGSEQKFSVVFFNDQAIPLFAPRASTGLIAASKANKQKAVRWIRSRKPDGLTNPEMALEMALGMRPSAIYFLTDGEFADPERLIERLARWNPNRIPIHTLTFGNRAGEAVMQAIAEGTGGTYRFVP